MVGTPSILHGDPHSVAFFCFGDEFFDDVYTVLRVRAVGFDLLYATSEEFQTVATQAVLA